MFCPKCRKMMGEYKKDTARDWDFYICYNIKCEYLGIERRLRLGDG